MEACSDRVHDVMDWTSQRGGTCASMVRKSSTSSVHRVHKKFSVLDSSFDAGGDDSVFVADRASTILVLYCGGTIGMRSRHGGTYGNGIDTDLITYKCLSLNSIGLD